MLAPAGGQGLDLERHAKGETGCRVRGWHPSVLKLISSFEIIFN